MFSYTFVGGYKCFGGVEVHPADGGNVPYKMFLQHYMAS
jgi:hypothetical protein